MQSYSLIRFPSRAAFALAFAFLLLSHCPVRAQVSYDGKRLLTFDDVFGPIDPLPAWGSLPYISGWAADGKHYLEFADNGAGDVQLMQVDPRTGDRAPLFDAPRMEAAFTALPGIDVATAHKLAYHESYNFDTRQTRALLEASGAIYQYDFTTGRAVRLTDTGAKAAPTEVSFSPDGKRIAFVRNGDIYVVDIATPGKERRLTRGGGPRVLNGRLDWVYEEEVYGRGRTDGYAWSPDSRQIAFLHLEETGVTRFALLNGVQRDQTLEEQLYPRPGEPNPIAGLGVVAADGRTPAHFIDLNDYPEQDRLIVRFAWTPDSARITCQIQDRVQTFLDLMNADPATGHAYRLLRETAQGHWVYPTDSPLWLKDGSFLWQSDRTGHRHLYRYRSNGALVGALTHGDWDIRTVFGADPATSAAVYFSATEHSPVSLHDYRLSLTDPAATPQRLTSSEGTHAGRFDPTFTVFLDEWSRFDMPPHLRVADTATGADIRKLGDSADTLRRLAPYRFARPEMLQVKTRDGFPMEATLIRPPDFDPAKRYPVICPVYGGPGAQTVRDEWSWQNSGTGSFLFWQMMAQKGYVIWLCDNRSASGKGVQSEWGIGKNLGAAELADIEDGLGYLKAQPWVDGARIGIFGWSYGGFLAEYALTHSKSFKIGIAAAGVSDWRLYDSIYTERYLDTPSRDPTGYLSSSAVAAAGDCTGRLLLLHGMMDDNVHYQNTIQMSYALQRAGKRFEMMAYPGPGARHGFADEQQDRHLNSLVVDFILRNL